MRNGNRVGGEDEAGANGVGSATEGRDALTGIRAGRLGGLLQDLLRVHGRRRTAELLDMSERTLQRVEASGQLSEQLCRALEKHEAELPGSGALPPLPPLAMETAAALVGLTRRVDKLETLEDSRSRDLRDVHAALEDLRQRVAGLEQEDRSEQAEQGDRGGDAWRTTRTDAPVGASTRTAGTAGHPHRLHPPYHPLRPEHPELVTVEAVPEEERVYGEAMTVITAWRRARRRRQAASTGLDKPGRLIRPDKLDLLKADERLLELELVLVGEHGLTVPPADRPWDGLRRQTELRVTREALVRVRRQRRWAWLRHWVLRLLTLGLCGRG